AGRLEVARWAIDNGLAERADDLYRQILAHDPSHLGAWEDLRRLSRRPPARDSEAYRRTRALLARRFRDYETDRYVILSDAGPRWTRA
ncbi:hypothetical protein L9G16_21510, partial [Shewanella sp. A25]|nr:hypothetical protein [Shewanella shenzhenensis]